MDFKCYEGKFVTKELLINNLKENPEVESIEELDYSIIINLKDKKSYDMLYVPINNKIKIEGTYEIHKSLNLGSY